MAQKEKDRSWTNSSNNFKMNRKVGSRLYLCKNILTIKKKKNALKVWTINRPF